MQTFQTPSWPTPEQIKKPVAIEIPQVMGRRAFLTVKRDAFTIPTKRIDTEEKLETWKASEAYLRIIDFITLLNESVKNKKLSDKCYQSENVQKIVAVLDQLDRLIDELPADNDNNSRFGNIVFRSWVERVRVTANDLTAQVLGEKYPDAVEEVATYLKGAFGDGTRIDYGSGHELSFTAWMCCFELLEIVTPKDYQALVVIVFAKYLKVVRKLQSCYNLEPAGSHGVWGLDDYQFLPYFWGSAQLIDHKHIKPKSITDKEIVSHFANEYLYLACINYINEHKKGPFHEHSPMLYDISGVQLWSKVNSGMLKMYLGEVLLKFPVVQHFLFGSLLPFEEAAIIEPPKLQ